MPSLAIGQEDDDDEGTTPEVGDIRFDAPAPIGLLHKKLKIKIIKIKIKFLII